MAARATGSASNRRASATIRSAEVPTSRMFPVAIPSGRSVFARSTSSGTPSAGASSWIPPEVAEDEVAIAHSPDQFAMAAGVAKRDIGAAAEQPPQRCRDMRVGRHDDLEPGARVGGELEHRGGDAIDAFAPAFAAMAGHEDRGTWPVSGRRRGKLVDHRQQRIDAGVAGDMDSPRNALAGEVEGGKVGRREQQRGDRVDLGPILLFRPRQGAVAGAQARFDMSDRDARRRCGAGSADRARRIALDDQQVRRIAGQRAERRLDRARVGVRILVAGTAEMHRRIAAQAVLGRVERLMLAGEDEPRLEAALGERVRDRGEFDGFRPGADDQPYVRGLQPSP